MSFCIRATRSGSGTSPAESKAAAFGSAAVGEARLDVAQRFERADHETRAHEQHERERDLRDDEHVLCAMTFAAVAAASAAAAARR